MMRQIAYFQDDWETGKMIPEWIVLDRVKLNWDSTLYIYLNTPFERMDARQFDVDIPSLSVPDFAYVRISNASDTFGISLPLLAEHIRRHAHADPDSLEIERLVLRISDVEDALQYVIRDYVKWD